MVASLVTEVSFGSSFLRQKIQTKFDCVVDMKYHGGDAAFSFELGMACKTL